MLELGATHQGESMSPLVIVPAFENSYRAREDLCAIS